MTNQTATLTTQYQNNASMATTVSKVVPLVVVNNQLVPDFRQANPGVISAAHTAGVTSGGTRPLQNEAQYS